MKIYHVAVVDSEFKGGWHILETFEANNNREAEDYAETNYSEKEWYVLDENEKNINGE